MKVINIADNKNRNTRVGMEHKKRARINHFVDSTQAHVQSVRVVKNTLKTDLKNLIKDCSLEELSQKLIDGDSEIDMELFGKRISDTTRIYINTSNEPASGVQTKELFYLPNGELKEERPFRDTEANINLETPLLWSGKLLPKKECYKKFVFVNAFQIQHVDGLTFDFLYSMAKELEDQSAMMFLGAGKKSNQPLVISRNGKQYRGFLEGRTKGKAYMLILHLTNLELKPLAKENDQ